MMRFSSLHVSFLRIRIAVAEILLCSAGLLPVEADEPERPLMAYVGTFSSPLGDVLPTQVDLPPGNGRGIHVLEVDRGSGAFSLDRHLQDGYEPQLPGGECLGIPTVLGQRGRIGWETIRRVRSVPLRSVRAMES